MKFRKPTLLSVIFLFLIGINQVSYAQFDPLELTVESTMGETGTQVCIDVTAKNFIDVESIQFNLSYDATLVSPVCPASYVHPVLALNIFGEIFNCNFKDNGYINFVWANDASTIPDDEVIFTLCFDIIGDAGNKTPIYFNGLILEIEVCQQGAGTSVCTGELISNVGTIMIVTNTLTGFFAKCDADGVNNIENAFITFYAAGGTPPYTYNVNGGEYTGSIPLEGERVTISNIPQKVYNIVITDANGLIYNFPAINVTNSFPLTFDTPIVKDPSCADRKNGMITLPNVDGIAPLTYQWSNFVSGGNGYNMLSDLDIGVYTVTVTDAFGCYRTESFNLVLDTLKLSVSVLDSASCNQIKDGRIMITAEGGSPFVNNTYQYSLNGTNWINFTNPFNVSNIGGGNFTFSVRDSIFCDTDYTYDPNDNMFNMPTKEQIDLFIVEKTDISCYGLTDGSVELGITPSNNYQFIALQNYPDVGLSVGNTFAASDLGSDDYGYYVINPRGCKDSIYFTIVEPSKILLDSVIVNPDCSSLGSITLNPSGGTPGTTGYNYTWSPAQTGNPNSITDLNGGLYSVTVADENNCSSTYSTTLNNSGTLAITAEIRKQISCFGKNDGELRVDILSSAGPFTIQWTNSLGNEVGIGQNLLGVGPGSYTVSVMASDGCSNTDTVTLLDGSAFDYAVDITTAPCSNDLGQAVITIAGDPNDFTFEWKTTGTSLIIDNDNTLNAVAGMYTVTVMNNSGCSKDSTIVLTAPQALVFPDPETRNVKCFGDSTGQAIILNAPAGYIFNWSTGSQGLFDAKLPAGMHYVIATDGTCFSDTVFFEVGTFPILELDDTKTFLLNPTCFGDTDGSVEVEAKGGTGMLYTYTWPSLAITGNSLSNIPAGEYEVIITDSNNCEQKDTFSLTQPQELVVSLNTALSTELDCNNQDAGKLVLQTTGGNTGLKTYVWSPGVVADRETASGLSAGTYCATVTDNKGCMDTICYELIAPAPLQGELNNPEEPACNGGSTCISVKYLVGGTGNKYTFQINNGTRYPIDSCVTVFAGSYFVSLIDSAGCSIDTIISINQPEPISVDLGDDQEIQLGLPSPIINALIDTPFALDTLQWTPTDSLTCLTSNCQTVSLSPATTTTYILTVTDQNGCTGSDDIEITVKNVRNVYFANIFTPNRDGNNDYFQAVIGPGVSRVESFLIFDRWGNKVYEQSNYVPDPAGSDGWDGTKNGTRLDPGVFVYYANVSFIDGKIVEYSGSVTLADKVRN